MAVLDSALPLARLPSARQVRRIGVASYSAIGGHYDNRQKTSDSIVQDIISVLNFQNFYLRNYFVCYYIRVISIVY